MNLVGGLSCWRGPKEHGPASPDRLAGPSTWLVQNADLLPRRGKGDAQQDQTSDESEREPLSV